MTITEGMLLFFLVASGTIIVSAEFPVRRPDGTINPKTVFQQCWAGTVLAGIPFGLGRLIEWIIQ